MISFGGSGSGSIGMEGGGGNGFGGGGGAIMERSSILSEPAFFPFFVLNWNSVICYDLIWK